MRVASSKYCRSGERDERPRAGNGVQGAGVEPGHVVPGQRADPADEAVDVRPDLATLGLCFIAFFFGGVGYAVAVGA